MDCILDKALSGLNPLSVRIVLNTGTFPKPAQEAVKLSNDTLNDTSRLTDSKLYLSKNLCSHLSYININAEVPANRYIT